MVTALWLLERAVRRTSGRGLAECQSGKGTVLWNSLPFRAKN